METLKNLFRCYICMDKVKDARLCPHCSKLCCLQCIRLWISDQQQPFCPHCRASMTMTEFINCRWVEEATQQLTSIQISFDALYQSPTLPDLTTCNKHKEKLSVYCITCNDAICHQCALWDKNHYKHNFKPLDEVYRLHVSKIDGQIIKLKNKLLDIFTSIKSIDKNMEDIKTAKDERIKELNNALDLMISRLESTMKEKMCSLEQVKQRMHYEMDRLESFLQKIGAELVSLSKADTIKNSGQIVGAFDKLFINKEYHHTLQFITEEIFPPQNELNCLTSHNNYHTNKIVSTDFPNEIIPPFNTAVFVVTDFPAARIGAEPIYSDPLKICGLEWRLKLYPDGNGAVRGQYLSVFLELTSCIHEHDNLSNKSVWHENNSQNTNEFDQEAHVTQIKVKDRSQRFKQPNFSNYSLLEKGPNFESSKYEYKIEMINQNHLNIQRHERGRMSGDGNCDKRNGSNFPSSQFIPQRHVNENGNNVNEVNNSHVNNCLDDEIQLNDNNNKEVKKNIIREFASDFEVGECWGYNRFFRLALLESEGFLGAGRKLVLRFSVRAPTFYQACRDRERYIHYLERKINVGRDKSLSISPTQINESPLPTQCLPNLHIPMVLEKELKENQFSKNDASVKLLANPDVTDNSKMLFYVDEECLNRMLNLGNNYDKSCEPSFDAQKDEESFMHRQDKMGYHTESFLKVTASTGSFISNVGNNFDRRIFSMKLSDINECLLNVNALPMKFFNQQILYLGTPNYVSNLTLPMDSLYTNFDVFKKIPNIQVGQSPCLNYNQNEISEDENNPLLSNDIKGS